MQNNSYHKRKFILPNSASFMASLLVFIGIIIGLFVTAQWRTRPQRITDPVLNYTSLQKTKDLLIREQEKYKESIRTLNMQSSEAQNVLRQYSQLEQKVNQVEQYEMKIGLTEFSGDGLVITLDDSKDADTTHSSISHAADLRDLVNLLWGAGAKAISINNERIVFNTSIDCIVNTILINSTKTTPPFAIKVVGDQDYLYYLLTNPNYLKDIHKRVSEEGLGFFAEKKSNIKLPAFTGAMKLEYAKLR